MTDDDEVKSNHATNPSPSAASQLAVLLDIYAALPEPLQRRLPLDESVFENPDQPVYVLVQGEMGSGKSTLINSVIGHLLLPALPEDASFTLCPTLVKRCDTPPSTTSLELFSVTIHYHTQATWSHCRSQAAQRVLHSVMDPSAAERSGAETVTGADAKLDDTSMDTDDGPATATDADTNADTTSINPWLDVQAVNNSLKAIYPAFNQNARELFRSDFMRQHFPRYSELLDAKAASDQLEEIAKDGSAHELPSVTQLLEQGSHTVPDLTTGQVSLLMRMLTTDFRSPADKVQYLLFYRLLSGSHVPSAEIQTFFRASKCGSTNMLQELYKYYSSPDIVQGQARGPADFGLLSDGFCLWPLVHYIEISGPFAMLPPHVTLVDTPGSGDIRAFASDDSISRAIGVIATLYGETAALSSIAESWYVVDSERWLSSDNSFAQLPALAVGIGLSKVLAVVSRFDRSHRPIDEDSKINFRESICKFLGHGDANAVNASLLAHVNALQVIDVSARVCDKKEGRMTAEPDNMQCYEVPLSPWDNTPMAEKAERDHNIGTLRRRLEECAKRRAESLRQSFELLAAKIVSAIQCQQDLQNEQVRMMAKARLSMSCVAAPALNDYLKHIADKLSECLDKLVSERMSYVRSKRSELVQRLRQVLTKEIEHCKRWPTLRKFVYHQGEFESYTVQKPTTTEKDNNTTSTTNTSTNVVGHIFAVRQQFAKEFTAVTGIDQWKETVMEDAIIALRQHLSELVVAPKTVTNQARNEASGSGVSGSDSDTDARVLDYIDRRLSSATASYFAAGVDFNVDQLTTAKSTELVNNSIALQQFLGKERLSFYQLLNIGDTMSRDTQRRADYDKAWQKAKEHYEKHRGSKQKRTALARQREIMVEFLSASGGMVEALIDSMTIALHGKLKRLAAQIQALFEHYRTRFEEDMEDSFQDYSVLSEAQINRLQSLEQQLQRYLTDNIAIDKFVIDDSMRQELLSHSHEQAQVQTQSPSHPLTNPFNKRKRESDVPVLVFRGLCAPSHRAADDLFPLMKSVQDLLLDPKFHTVSAFVVCEAALRAMKQSPNHNNKWDVSVEFIDSVAAQVQQDLSQHLQHFEPIARQHVRAWWNKSRTFFKALYLAAQQRYTNSSHEFMREYNTFCDRCLKSNGAPPPELSRKNAHYWQNEVWKWCGNTNYEVPRHPRAAELHGNPFVSVGKSADQALSYGVGYKKLVQGVYVRKPLALPYGDNGLDPLDVPENLRGKPLGIFMAVSVPRDAYELALARHANDTEALHEQKEISVNPRFLTEEEVCFYGHIDRAWPRRTWEIPFLSFGEYSPKHYKHYGIVNAQDPNFGKIQRAIVKYVEEKRRPQSNAKARESAESALRLALADVIKEKIRNDCVTATDRTFHAVEFNKKNINNQ